MQNKPRLSFWQIWNMSFGFMGIQIGFALQQVPWGGGANANEDVHALVSTRCSGLPTTA